MKDEDFFKQVLAVARQIPYGRVTNYGAIARALGSAQSSRMVGWAMHTAYTDSGVPAHRVVNRQGLLTGKMHFGSPQEMQRRLEAEGIQVKNNRVVRFKELFWDPQTLAAG